MTETTQPHTSSTMRIPVADCCGKPMSIVGGLEKALDQLRHPAGKRERRDVYVYTVCENCGFVQRILVGHRPKKNRTPKATD